MNPHVPFHLDIVILSMAKDPFLQDIVILSAGGAPGERSLLVGVQAKDLLLARTGNQPQRSHP